MNTTRHPITAAALYAEAWAHYRAPRSTEYKAGTLALLSYQLVETEHCLNPHRFGTAEADAFWAGVDEGWQILRNHGIAPRRVA